MATPSSGQDVVVTATPPADDFDRLLAGLFEDSLILTVSGTIEQLSKGGSG
jgi:hypothetical protein